MNLKVYSIAAITALSFLSCAQKDKADEVDESLFSPAPVKPAQVAAAKDSLVQNNVTLPQTSGISPATGTINAGQQVNPQATAIQAPAQVNTAGLNPAHGQPGHRCDISVGAPLNSKPAPQNATPAPIAVSSSPSAPTITAVPVTTPTAPGMNPPHGQPNHRCDIAVGAPLNSKPAVAPATAPAPIMVTPVVVSDSTSKQ